MSALWASFAVALLAAAPVERRPEPRNALERLARQTADALAERAPEPPLALYVRADAAELERGFTSLLASELAARKLAPVALRVPTPEAAEPAAREQGARSLARLTLALEHGLLQARGDLTGTWVNFWAGQVPTRPAQPAAALAQSTEADAHALALAARPPPV
ncbi:MAG TPA: VCBS repeat-containing protein, partial [Myxococcaceae bacterium]|nr:VCBS repeat-containing protein [Myxococcaceae bacterium]